MCDSIVLNTFILLYLQSSFHLAKLKWYPLKNSSFTERFYKNLMSSFVKCLFCFYSDVHCNLTFVNVINHIDWFWMLNSFCISGNNLTYIYFIYCWNRFGDTFGLECSLFYVHKIYSSLSLQWLPFKKWWPHKMSWEV